MCELYLNFKLKPHYCNQIFKSSFNWHIYLKKLLMEKIIYTIIAVGPLFVCVYVAELLRDQWSDHLHFWHKYQAHTRDCTDFFL